MRACHTIYVKIYTYRKLAAYMSIFVGAMHSWSSIRYVTKPVFPKPKTICSSWPNWNYRPIIRRYCLATKGIWIIQGILNRIINKYCWLVTYSTILIRVRRDFSRLWAPLWIFLHFANKSKDNNIFSYYIAL